ncbi:hypothetical protein EV138_3402 [Kribbella voronezhensis]|uniref:Uncharacterized protein n=1 Tax=Kribbella voronezhensis TaxID=2512212 RepID=A0A4R7TCQ9_9ACTN|nr:hypothetical protein [Kribbella voronezhensis]TDU89825.1 hypothetical protein EV138_3402 [Kribbella voronezhensis]
MTQTPSDSSPNPDLSDLMDKSAEEWSAPEIQDAARSAMQLHAPDREPLTWIKRFGVVPWLHRNDAVCRECGGTYPCITHRYATQLLSAGRITTTRPPTEEEDTPGPITT